MEPHPRPPADLHAQALPLIARSGPFARIHKLVDGPIYFGRGHGNRFDSPTQDFGVLYVGESDEAAFIETFGHTTGARTVSAAALKLRGLTTLVSARALSVVDLSGPNLARLGADSRIFAGDIDVAQAWAAAFFRHPDAPDGIRYPCRHDNAVFSVAVFSGADRDGLFSPTSTRHLGTKASAPMVGALMNRYGFAEI